MIYRVNFISQVYLDGPFGAPSSDIFRAEHAALIATGIGVTPFSSILQSIMFRYKERPQCSLEEVVQTLKKVDFFWINRDHKSFEWFVNLLDQLETDQRVAVNNKGHERFMEFHLYFTQALQKSDIRAVGLQVALELLYKKVIFKSEPF